MTATLHARRTLRPSGVRPSIGPVRLHVHKGADPLTSAEAELRSELLGAISRLQESASGQQVLSALLGPDPQSAVDSLDWQGWSDAVSRMETTLASRWADAANASVLDVAPGLGSIASFPPALATEYATHFAGDRITAITDATREAVGSIVSRATREGWSVPRTVSVLGNTAGLPERWAQAVANFQAGLEAAGTQDGYIRMAVTAYRDRLGTARATMIARTELLDAANQGRVGGWQLSAAAGIIGPDATMEWVAGSDPCPDCEDLDGQTAPLGGTFDSGDDAPPAHPNCACTVVISDLGTVPDQAGDTGSTPEGGGSE